MVGKTWSADQLKIVTDVGSFYLLSRRIEEQCSCRLKQKASKRHTPLEGLNRHLLEHSLHDTLHKVCYEVEMNL